MNRTEFYLCKLLISEECTYTFDADTREAGRSDKALVMEIIPFYHKDKVNEVLSMFMGEPIIYRVGEYVIADGFNVTKVGCGIHFFIEEQRAILFLKNFFKRCKGIK